jgi:hypothetical protein
VGAFFVSVDVPAAGFFVSVGAAPSVEGFDGALAELDAPARESVL